MSKNPKRFQSGAAGANTGFKNIALQKTFIASCGRAFPSNGVKAEATPNTEMILVADVDLDLWKELHEHSSVHNLRDRRTDVYRLELK